MQEAINISFSKHYSAWLNCLGVQATA